MTMSAVAPVIKGETFRSTVAESRPDANGSSMLYAMWTRIVSLLSYLVQAFISDM